EQLGGEGGVAAGDATLAQQSRQHQVRVGVLLADHPQALEGHLPGRGGAPGALGGAGGGVAAAGAALAAGAGALAALCVAAARGVLAAAAGAVRSAAVLAAASLLAHACSPSGRAGVKAASAARAAPRAQSAARIGRLPAGARVDRAMTSVPVPTSSWRRVAASRPGGSGSCSGAASTPRILVRAPSRWVQAPGCG